MQLCKDWQLIFHGILLAGSYRGRAEVEHFTTFQVQWQCCNCVRSALTLSSQLKLRRCSWELSSSWPSLDWLRLNNCHSVPLRRPTDLSCVPPAVPRSLSQLTRSSGYHMDCRMPCDVVSGALRWVRRAPDAWDSTTGTKSQRKLSVSSLQNHQITARTGQTVSTTGLVTVLAR